VKKSLIILPAVQAKIAALPELEKEACWLAPGRLCEEFGQPHLHSGLGIRKLRRHYFECRAGLKWRLVFRDDDAGLIVLFLGNHDEIRQFIERQIRPAAIHDCIIFIIITKGSRQLKRHLTCCKLLYAK
jgi:hypothetical protein